MSVAADRLATIRVYVDSALSMLSSPFFCATKASLAAMQRLGTALDLVEEVLAIDGSRDARLTPATIVERAEGIRARLGTLEANRLSRKCDADRTHHLEQLVDAADELDAAAFAAALEQIPDLGWLTLSLRARQ